MAGGRERGWVVEHFAGLVDPRAERAKRHEVLDIIVITICGVICGADNWVEIEEFWQCPPRVVEPVLTAAQRHSIPRYLWAGVRPGWTQTSSAPVS